MRNRYLLGAGVALAMTFGWANAQAQLFGLPGGPGHVYFGGEGGWTHLDNATARTAGLKADEHFNDGFNVGGRLGYEFGPLSIEEEFRWQQNDINGLGAVGVSGIRSAYAFMTNAIYNFTFPGLSIPITPHVGVGVGAVELRDSINVPGLGTISGGTDWELGYQGIAGIRYNVNPSLAFDIDYRYLGTTDPTFNFRGVAAGLGSYKSEYSSHSVLASFIVKFGAAPPPPPPPVAAPPAPPAPPPVVRKVFLVFFDWDKATITPEGMQVVQQAAAAWRSGAPVQIQVTGYTDLSGSAGYNQRLSERRANNVAVALIRSGVPRNEMAVSGRGENDPRVPTAQGVREPQNRRVEIVFP